MFGEWGLVVVLPRSLLIREEGIASVFIGLEILGCESQDRRGPSEHLGQAAGLWRVLERDGCLVYSNAGCRSAFSGQVLQDRRGNGRRRGKYPDCG